MIKNIVKGLKVINGVGGVIGKGVRNIKKAVPKQNKPVVFPQKAMPAIPKDRITPVYKPAQPVRTGGAVSDMEVKMLQKKMPKKMPKLPTTLPKKAMPMNYKNPKYKPSNGVGVGY